MMHWEEERHNSKAVALDPKAVAQPRSPRNSKIVRAPGTEERR